MPKPERPAEVPAGAAVMPAVPEELGIHPLLLAALHAVVFMQGSDEKVVDPAAAQEQLELIAACLQRLKGDDLARVREDIHVLAGFVKEEGWPKSAQQFFTSFLSEFGIGRSRKS